MGAQDGECADRIRVSVITIFLDGEAFLSEAIESVIAQSFEGWELLLVDDGSGPTATAIAKAYASRFPQKIRYLDHPGHVNRGMSATRNLGIQHARGEFIAFIDADDIWLPSTLADRVALLDAHPEVGMVCGTAIFWYSGSSEPDKIVPMGHRQDVVVHPPEAALAVYPLGTAHPACPSAVAVRADLVRLVGGFEEQFVGFLEDQAFFSKVYLASPVYFSSAALFRYRRHPNACVDVVMQAGKYEALRLEFLEWLETYLAAQEKVDLRVIQSLQRALRHYRRPHMHFMLSLPSRVYNRCRRWGSGVSHLLWR